MSISQHGYLSVQCYIYVYIRIIMYKTYATIYIDVYATSAIMIYIYIYVRNSTYMLIYIVCIYPI